MSESNEQQTGVYKIKRLSELTGFLPTLLRAWERRYEFLFPDRLPGGHRLYTEEDYRALRTVKVLLDQGYSVGEAAALGRDRLLELGSELELANESDEPSRHLAERESVIDLASAKLGVHRTSRYRGEGLGISLRDLDKNDLVTICRLYDVVKRTYELWSYMSDRARDEQLVMNYLLELLNPALQAAIARLGTNSLDPKTLLLRSALDDARHGALGPLLSRLQAAAPGPFSHEQAVVLVTLARDHAKILRNAFEDLDPTLRSADESSKAHGLRGILSKLDKVMVGLETISELAGSVSSRCLETSAMDRVLYDYLRRIDSLKPSGVKLRVVSINDQLTRWAFSFDKENFVVPTAEELPTIAVAHAVGVSADAALEQGYLGAKNGWAWFHWPIFRPEPGATICECEL